MTEQSSVRTAPPGWDDTFRDILDGGEPLTQTSKIAPPGARLSGFVVVASGAASLQAVQDLCAERTAPRCLSVRYRVGRAPLPGSLFAAFAADLATFRSGDAGLVGQFSPLPSADSSWPRMIDHPATAALISAHDFAVERTGSHLDDRWLDLFGDFVRQVFGRNDQLVLLAEADDSLWTTTQDVEALRGLAARLPASCGLVLGAPDLVETASPSDPSFAVLRVSGPEQPSRSSAKYRDVELTGDQLADRDSFDRSRYAEALATLVLLPDTGPMTIGIHAPWGAGKSSFMRFVEWHLIQHEAGHPLPTVRALNLFDPMPDTDPKAEAKALGLDPSLVRRLRRTVARRVIPIWFNAWQYEGANQIWAGLTHQITQGMERGMPRWRRLATRVGYAVRRRGPQFWLGVFTPLVVALIVAGVWLVVGGEVSKQLPKEVQSLVATLPATVVTVLGFLFVLTRFFKRTKPVSEGLLDYVRQPNYREHMGYQHQVLEDIRYLAGRLRRRGKWPRVFVFIDDLDRCSDEKVLETLQAINLLLTASSCYVFLGIDTDMIIRAIQRHFDFEEDAQEKARSYLRKILQINLRLHAPDSYRKLDFLGSFFTEDSRRRLAEALASTGAGPPPGQPPLAWDLAEVSPPTQYAVRLDEVTDTVHELWAFHQLSDLVPTNPRELKRLVNVHRLVRIITKSAGVHPSATEQRLLVGWLLFCFEAPHWAARLVTQARAENAALRDEPVKDARLEAILARLDDDPTQPADGVAMPCRLTTSQLQRGTAYSEAWEISSLVRMSG